MISVGGTLINLNKINRLIPGLGITGMAQVSTGMVNVTITQRASLNVTDTKIDFGSCAPPAGGCLVESNSSSAMCSCTGLGKWPDNITVENDGNVNINVTVKTNKLAVGMLGSADAQFNFSTRNDTVSPGCQRHSNGASLQWDWKNFTSADYDYNACGNLSFAYPNDRIQLFAQLWIPSDAVIQDSANATLTFSATALPTS